jgi:hypothetical protein
MTNRELRWNSGAVLAAVIESKRLSILTAIVAPVCGAMRRPDNLALESQKTYQLLNCG